MLWDHYIDKNYIGRHLIMCGWLSCKNKKNIKVCIVDKMTYVSNSRC
jgi:hypothetical protein